MHFTDFIRIGSLKRIAKPVLPFTLHHEEREKKKGGKKTAKKKSTKNIGDEDMDVDEDDGEDDDNLQGAIRELNVRDSSNLFPFVGTSKIPFRQCSKMKLFPRKKESS